VLSPVHFLHHVLCSFVFCFLFIMLISSPTVVLNACQKVINGVGWPHDRHGLSPILYDASLVFIYTDQLLCHRVFICSNFPKRLVYCMRWLLWCFCFLAESYETINHCHYLDRAFKIPDRIWITKSDSPLISTEQWLQHATCRKK